jgi:hypothetical protein
MANDGSPKFQLNGTQMLALTLIELQQTHLTAAANAVAERSGEKDAAKLLADAARILEAAKLEWLHSTQRAIRVVSTIPAMGPRDKASRTTGRLVPP